MLEKIVSGGQTGVDRAALDVALELGLQIGGWVPKGRTAEDGTIPERYPGLREADSPDPGVRTALNVRDSDATLVFSRGALVGGSLLAYREAERLGRPVLHVDLGCTTAASGAAQLREWLAAVRPTTLNVAGPRQSEAPGIGAQVAALLSLVLPPAHELPIACTLTPDELAARRAGLLPGLLARSSAREAIASGFRWRFAPQEGLLQEIAAVLAAEHRCCRFLRFHLVVEPGDGPVWLEVTGPEGTEGFLDALLDVAPEG